MGRRPSYSFAEADAITETIVLVLAGLAKKQCGAGDEEIDEMLSRYFKTMKPSTPAITSQRDKKEQNLIKILSYLESGESEDGRYLMKDIICNTGIGYGKLSQVLSRDLSWDGYIEKTKAPEGKRILVSITEKGSKELEELIKKRS